MNIMDDVRWALIVLLVCASPATSWAEQDTDLETELLQDETTISADRPGFTTGASIVPSGRLQAAAGLSYTFVDSQSLGDISAASQHVASAPNLMVRYGVVDFAEVRLHAPNLSLDFAAPVSSADPTFGAAALGAKLAASVSDTVALAVLPTVAVGIEDGDVSAGAVAILDAGLTDAFGVIFNVGATNFETSADERDFEYLASAAACLSLTDEVGAYAEWYTTIQVDDAHFAETGLTYLISPLLQVDAFAGLSVPDAATIYGGAGVATLF